MDSSKNKPTELAALLPLIEERLAGGHSVTFSPRGISMLPMLREGRDTVTLSPLPDRLKKYDLPLYRRPGGQFVLHRIVRVGKSYRCIGDNQFLYEDGVTRAQMIAVVTAFTRDGRAVPATSPGYRLYCRLWHFGRPLRRLWLGGISRLRSLFSK